MWTVKLHPRVVKEVQRWPRTYRHRFERLVDELQIYGPRARTQDVKRMAGEKNSYRARIGRYRVRYEALVGELRIYVINAGIRGGIYK